MRLILKVQDKNVIDRLDIREIEGRIDDRLFWGISIASKYFFVK